LTAGRARNHFYYGRSRPGAIDIRNRDGSDLKLHVDWARVRDLVAASPLARNGVHLDLLCASDARARFVRHRAENNSTKVLAIPLDC
jgi:hypothetical protein